jgi:hypothetical protein
MSAKINCTPFTAEVEGPEPEIVESDCARGMWVNAKLTGASSARARPDVPSAWCAADVCSVRASAARFRENN